MAANVKRIAAVPFENIWSAVAKTSPSFQEHTAKGTMERFKSLGFEGILKDQLDTKTFNEFLSLSMKAFLQKVIGSSAGNPLRERGLLEYYDQPYGGLAQRIAVSAVKPVTPVYKDKTQGGWVNPYVQNFADTSERFYPLNFDYQGVVTIGDDTLLKTSFNDGQGVSELIAGFLEGLESSYTIQEFENAIECLNAAINSTATPLQDSQVVTISGIGSSPTAEGLTNLVKTVQKLASTMKTVPATSSFNAGKFQRRLSPEDHVILLRSGYKTDLSVGITPELLIVNALRPETLSLGMDIIEVPNFGGLVPYKEQAFTTQLYPVYSNDQFKQQIGWAETGGATAVTVQNGSEFYKDPNSDVVAVIAQRGVIFETSQNPYNVEPIRNPMALRTNFIATRPNTGITYDSYYTFIVIKNQS